MTGTGCAEQGQRNSGPTIRTTHFRAERPLPRMALPISPARHCLALTLLTIGTLASASAAAAARLSCEVDQGGELRQFLFEATSDPYAPRPIDIGRHFRFKAVVVGSDAAIEYVKLYTYYRTVRQPVLLQQLSYRAPPTQRRDAGPHALTGTVDVYSPDLGRHLSFGCALREVTR